MTSAHLSRQAVLALVAAPCMVWAAGPTEEVTLDASRDYLVGLSTGVSRPALGGDGYSAGITPLLAFQWGRWRLASGGASALLSLGRKPVDAGLSTQVFQSDRWSMSTSFQWDQGRGSSDAPLLQGMPEVDGTVRGRLSVGYRIASRWSLGLGASQDLLGHGGGLLMSGGLTYHQPLTVRSYWDVSLGVQWGSATYMRSYYGVAPDVAAALGRAAYVPGAGVNNLSLGWGMASALTDRWVVFGNVSVSSLQGDARHSPLVAHPNNVSARVGLAYRCCH